MYFPPKILNIHVCIQVWNIWISLSTKKDDRYIFKELLGKVFSQYKPCDHNSSIHFKLDDVFFLNIIGILCVLFQDTFGPKIMMYFFLIYHICFSEPRTEKYQAHVSEQISNIHKSNGIHLLNHNTRLLQEKGAVLLNNWMEIRVKLLNLLLLWKKQKWGDW